MKALDLGCGTDPQRWLPGADLCDYNIGNTGRIKSYTSLTEVPSKAYDFIWYRYGERQNGEPLTTLVKEISRVAKRRATLVLADYREVINWDSYKTKSVTVKEWTTRLLTAFGEKGWLEDSTYIGWANNAGEGLLILTKNWG